MEIQPALKLPSWVVFGRVFIVSPAGNVEVKTGFKLYFMLQWKETLKEAHCAGLIFLTTLVSSKGRISLFRCNVWFLCFVRMASSIDDSIIAKLLKPSLMDFCSESCQILQTMIQKMLYSDTHI